jgi:DNA-binding MarR family transcriptional regulator
LTYTPDAVSAKPTRSDVQDMVVALFTTKAGLDRARRRSKGASALAVLQVLEHRDGVRPSEIAATLQVHASFVTRQVQELEEAVLVAVRADGADGRSCLVALTEQGQQELQRLREIGLARFASFVADWDATEVCELTRLLTKLEASKAAVSQRERRTARPNWRQRS